MIIIAGTIDLIDPASRDELLARTILLQKATRDEEPGCELYCFAADPVVEGRIQITELWSDEQSLAAHFTHPNYLNMRTILNGSRPSGPPGRCEVSL